MSRRTKLKHTFGKQSVKNKLSTSGISNNLKANRRSQKEPLKPIISFTK